MTHSLLARALTLCLAAALPALPAPAQDPQGGALGRLHQEFQKRRLELLRSGASDADLTKLTDGFIKDLRAYLKTAAKGLDRFNGRLMLVDYLLATGRRDEAKKELLAFNVRQAPVLAIAAAAEVAGYLGLGAERAAWIDAALKRPASFEDRMLLGMALLTRLQEIEKGEKVFADALAAAKDDEERARVLWWQADATREREDLHGVDDPYGKALQALADRYPDTHYGSIARDRLRARQLRPGSDAIPFEVTALDGRPLALDDLRGRVVLLDFWASWCDPSRKAAPALRRLYRDFRDAGLEIVGINMDSRLEDAQRAIAAMKAEWRHVCDGKGAQAEVALRYNIDDPGRMILIDRDGKIASLHIHPVNAEGEADARRAIERALGKSR